MWLCRKAEVVVLQKNLVLNFVPTQTSLPWNLQDDTLQCNDKVKSREGNENDATELLPPHTKSRSSGSGSISQFWTGETSKNRRHMGVSRRRPLKDKESREAFGTIDGDLELFLPKWLSLWWCVKVKGELEVLVPLDIWWGWRERKGLNSQTNLLHSKN